MPIYLYSCDRCGEFERKQPFDEEPLAVCPKCSAPVRRVISPIPHVFKGRLASRAFGGKDKMQDGV